MTFGGRRIFTRRLLHKDLMSLEGRGRSDDGRDLILLLARRSGGYTRANWAPSSESLTPPSLKLSPKPSTASLTVSLPVNFSALPSNLRRDPYRPSSLKPSPKLSTASLTLCLPVNCISLYSLSIAYPERSKCTSPSARAAWIRPSRARPTRRPLCRSPSSRGPRGGHPLGPSL
jgi:hypothetical protein